MANEEYKQKREFEGIEGLTGDQKIHIKRFQNQAKEYINNPRKTESLVSKAIKKAEISKNNEAIKNLWDRIHLLFELLRDWAKGNYRSISKSALLAIVAGLIYFVSPIDAVPDFIVGLGLVDDALVLGLIINQLDKELDSYQQWKKFKNVER